MDDDMLFSVMAEAAYLFETEYDPEDSLLALTAFNSAFTERIAPKFTPQLLYEVLAGKYPSWFKIYTLQGVEFTHGLPYQSTQRSGPDYAEVLKKALYDPNIRADDNLTGEILRSIPWGYDNNEVQVLYDVYNTSAEQSRSSIFALGELELLDPAMVKRELFSILDRYEEFEESVLMAYLFSLEGLIRENPEMGEDICGRMFAFTEQYLASDMPFSEHFTNCLITRTGVAYGRAYKKGMVRYIMEHKEQIPDFQFALLTCSEYLYPEVNDLLLSQDEQEVRWALDWVSAHPYEYYLENLRLIQPKSKELGLLVKQLQTTCETESAYMPLPQFGLEASNEK